MEDVAIENGAQEDVAVEDVTKEDCAVKKVQQSPRSKSLADIGKFLGVLKTT